MFVIMHTVINKRLLFINMIFCLLHEKIICVLDYRRRFLQNLLLDVR